MSTLVHAVATPLNTCRASRACRDERVAPCCQKARHHVTTFCCAKMHGLDSVSCHVVMWRNKWNLGFSQWHNNCRIPFTAGRGRIHGGGGRAPGLPPYKSGPAAAG